MDWLKKLLGNNPVLAMIVPSLLSLGNFAVNLIAALSNDGIIDPNEYKQLIASANGLETLILFAIMYALSKKKD